MFVGHAGDVHFEVGSEKVERVVREGVLIPFKIAPLVPFHPETIEMEGVQRDIPVRHPLDKAGHCLLINLE